jgi:RHS repeat-associated protein
LGSSSVLVNSSNNTVVNGSRTWYLPFGGYRPGSTPTQTITDRDFTGQHENMELGLLYYNARFYAPGLGRFISADTIIPNPADPQSYNRYSYVLNRALNFTDPTGHISCTELGTEECDENGDFVEAEDPITETEDAMGPFQGAVPPWWTKEQIQQLRDGTLSKADWAEKARYGGLLHTYVQLWFKETIRPTAQLEVYIPYADGGYGFADLVDGAEIWEVKPNSIYGNREAASAQLAGYVANRPGSRIGSQIPQLMNGGVVLQHPLTPQTRELVVKMDPSDPLLQGIIIYQERNKTDSRAYQPSFEYNPAWAQDAMIWAAIGLGIYGALGGGGGNQPGLVH